MTLRQDWGKPGPGSNKHRTNIALPLCKAPFSPLIDEYCLAVHPVTLGQGLPIFSDLAKPFDLKLVDAKAFPGGIVVHTYQPA
ncbi:hypothetical protein [uncultured Chitinophaga sp.]|jgi:Dihydrofolate reductase|uniref:hypothetical protein n=1 Tax=uncultured Chitinophaga sp. TaxID=339340 RepID=UPI00260B5D54|nr:hypothetical protein [uncultured Chitinophaga sp.]